MSLPECQKLLDDCAPLITNYLNALATRPEKNEAEKNYKALFVFAEIQRGESTINYNSAQRQNIAEAVRQTGDFAHFVPQLAAQPLRQATGGCGLFGGSSPTISLFRPFSVAEFAYRSINTNSEDTSDFQCPGRKKDGKPCTYIVRYGSGVKKCPECGMEATCG